MAIDQRGQDLTDRKTVLMCAAERGDVSVVVQLIAIPNININAATTKDGMTALMLAANKGHDVVVARLLAVSHVDVNAATTKCGMTALMLAANKGHDMVVARLLAAPGVDVNAIDNRGLNALQLAIEAGHAAVQTLLLDFGKKR